MFLLKKEFKKTQEKILNGLPLHVLTANSSLIDCSASKLSIVNKKLSAGSLAIAFSSFSSTFELKEVNITASSS